MSYHRFTTTLLAASILLAASAANATNTGIARCVTETGIPAFTDTPCPDGMQQAHIVRVSMASPATMRAQAAKKDLAEAGRARAAKYEIQEPPGRNLPGDVAMMKVAHAVLAANDAPGILARKQALIEFAEARAASYWAWLVPMSAFRNNTQ